MSTQVHATQKPLALVIGATGSIGGEVARNLLARGWRVRGLNRDPSRAARTGPAGIEWARGDAMIEADVVEAAKGARIILHGANPPGYSSWAKLLPPMMENVIAAARASGARIILPGNVYNYGPDAWPRFTETSPQNPRTRKGVIRVGLERRLEAVAAQGVRSLVVRAGDFFGPRSGTSWLTEGWVQKGKPLKAVSLPGPAEITHAWAYLPDFAESIVRLAERDADLPAFAVFNHGGHQLTGGQMADALERVADWPASPCPGWPWPPSRPSSRCCARCGRCATSGTTRCCPTTPSWSRPWATSPTRPSTKRYVPRLRVKAASKPSKPRPPEA
jgi:nucleoside-diphosphate-sugar epimerase